MSKTFRAKNHPDAILFFRPKHELPSCVAAWNVPDLCNLPTAAVLEAAADVLRPGSQGGRPHSGGEQDNRGG